MNAFQMLAILLLLALIVDAYLMANGFATSYLSVLAGLAILKGIALFLVPEKAPIVLVKSPIETEED